MIKFKLAFSIVALFASSLAYSAEQSMHDILEGHKRAGAAPAKYIVVYGKVIAKRTAAGFTKFEYRDGIVVSEKTPSGAIGTYMYGHQGRLEEIQYTDGKRVKVAYGDDGKVKEVSGVGRKIARFGKDAPVAPAGKEKVGNFLHVQEGMEAMDGDGYCDTGSLESDCVINIGGRRGGGSGIEPGYPGADPGQPGAGGGGRERSGGGGGGGTGTPYATVEECKKEVCDDGNSDMEEACLIMARTIDDLRRCRDKAFEFYGYCLRSCSSGDWAWLDTFNYVW